MSSHLLTRCRSLYEVLDAFLEKRLGRWDRMLIRGHLMMCPQCRRYLGQYEAVRRRVEVPGPTDLPADFEDVMNTVMKRWKKDCQ